MSYYELSKDTLSTLTRTAVLLLFSLPKAVSGCGVLGPARPIVAIKAMPSDATPDAPSLIQTSVLLSFCKIENKKVPKSRNLVGRCGAVAPAWRSCLVMGMTKVTTPKASLLPAQDGVFSPCTTKIGKLCKSTQLDRNEPPGRSSSD